MQRQVSRLKVGRSTVLAMGLATLACAQAPRAAEAAAPDGGAGGGAPAARAEAPSYALSLAAQDATATIKLVAKGGFKVNDEYPMHFKPETSAGVTFSGSRIDLRAKAVKSPCGHDAKATCEVTAPFTFTPTADGPKTLAGTVAFSVCTKDQCLIEKVRLAAQVD